MPPFPQEAFHSSLDPDSHNPQPTFYGPWTIVEIPVWPSWKTRTVSHLGARHGYQKGAGLATPALRRPIAEEPESSDWAGRPAMWSDKEPGDPHSGALPLPILALWEGPYPR